MPQKGSHTWSMLLHYHRCPSCGFIMENRDDYQYRLGKYIKQLECTRCHHAFTETKSTKPSFGPFTGDGDAQPAEMDWDREK